MSTTIYREFTFEAAHQLGANVGDGHQYGRVHGHSFYATVSITGEPSPDTGWVADFSALDRAIKALQARLDHQYLNEIEGLELPTLENIARWIFTVLREEFDGISQVEVRRPSCSQGCIYTG